MQMRSIADMKEHVLQKANEDEGYRARLIANPNAVISEEMGIPIPEEFEIKVHEDSPTVGHFVLSPSDRLTEADLVAVAGGGASWKVGNM